MVAFESGRHPTQYDTLVVYLVFMKAKYTASKWQLRNKVYFNPLQQIQTKQLPRSICENLNENFRAYDSCNYSAAGPIVYIIFFQCFSQGVRPSRPQLALPITPNSEAQCHNLFKCCCEYFSNIQVNTSFRIHNMMVSTKAYKINC